MSQPTKTAWLNCHVLGDTIDELIHVEVSFDFRIFKLRDAIRDIYQQWGYGQLQNPVVLSKVDFPLSELPNVPAQLTESRLITAHRVERYWDNLDLIDEDRVHVLVRAIGQQITAKKFREGNSASVAAVHSQFAVEQQHSETAILNGRPQERVGLPVQLFHPVFDTFTKTMESTNLLPPSKYVHTEELLHASQDIYREDGREGALMSHLIIALASTIDNEPVPNCNAAGVVKFVDTATASNAYCAIIEVKNEIGTGECDPTIQAAESFAIYWSQEKMTPLRNICCCPSLIIAIAGPWMCVLGAVYLRNPVVQPLTDYIWLGHHPLQDRRLTHLTRVFHAAAVSIDELQEYYKSLLSRPLPSLDLARFFPYARQYPDSNGGLVDLDYLGLVDNDFPLRPVFRASTGTDRNIIVKFAERYNIEAHQMLVPEGLAPKVLYYNANFSHGGLRMIVMEEVPGITLERHIELHGIASLQALTTLRKNIRDALRILHDVDLVFGDLRPPNILVVEPTDGEPRGML
ncbi:hypothetical protein FRC06_004116, partial [Ceratobasidium sp. 370]